MKTREDAIAAVRDLLDDLKKNPESWENPTLDRYLEALGAWLEDSGKIHNQSPSWELIVDMLEAAKFYE